MTDKTAWRHPNIHCVSSGPEWTVGEPPINCEELRTLQMKHAVLGSIGGGGGGYLETMSGLRGI